MIESGGFLAIISLSTFSSPSHFLLSRDSEDRKRRSLVVVPQVPEAVFIFSGDEFR